MLRGTFGSGTALTAADDTMPALESWRLNSGAAERLVEPVTGANSWRAERRRTGTPAAEEAGARPVETTIPLLALSFSGRSCALKRCVFAGRSARACTVGRSTVA